MRNTRLLISIFVLIMITFMSSKVNAKEITEESKIKLNGDAISSKVTDNTESTYITVSKESEIEITSEDDIYSIYVVYEFSSKTGTLIGNDKTANIGENNFLHEYINVEEKIGISNDIKIKYDEDVKIAEIYIIGEGEIPDFVEIWNPPYEKADLLLFSTHSDDEQLFMLGLMPTYVARGAYVQVVYFANHNDNTQRLHEQIHGLYTVGIRNYPILGIVPDAYSETLEKAISNMEASNITEDDAIRFQVENIRRFKPQVVVGHDEKGEYSHGQHILNTYCLEKAILYTNDKTYDEESYNQYGLWQISKLYLHLYEKNQITMDYDIPLEYFNGKTAYEVSKEGYSKHLSQQWTWFTKWINGPNNSYKKATEITTYSPLLYGLYYTNVGEDIKKNDMFENLTFYSIQEEEEKQKEKKEKEEKQYEEETKEEQEQKNGKKKYIFIIILILFLLRLRVVMKKRKKKKKRRYTKRNDYDFNFSYDYDFNYGYNEKRNRNSNNNNRIRYKGKRYR